MKIRLFIVIVYPIENSHNHTSMTRARSLSPGMQNIVGRVIEEANSETDSWSLATYTAVRNATRSVTGQMAMSFVAPIMQELLKDGQTVLTRYKLAQMCTILKATPSQQFGGAFQRYEASVAAIYAELECGGDLGRGTAQLLRTLFRSGQTMSPLPTQSANMRSKTPAPMTNRVIGSFR